MKDILYKIYKFSNSWTGTIIIVLFVIFFVAQAFRIPSGSMKDSLLIGDHLFAKKFSYGVPMPHIPFIEVSIMPWSDKLKLIDGAKPKRGEIVIFRPPHDHKTHYVKRCVALEGDEIFISDKILYLHPKEGNEYAKQEFSNYELIEFDGKLWVKDPYTKEHRGIHNDNRVVNDGRFPPELFNMHPVKIEDGYYFMMGDNRDHSNDSRFWGAVPYENLEGTPWFVYFSMDENYRVRWDRIGKGADTLGGGEYLDRSIAERKSSENSEYEFY